MTVAVSPVTKELSGYRITVRGQVQGVGFRPFVHRVATELGLRGRVNNCDTGVAIEILCAAPVLDEFIGRLRTEAPTSARITAVDCAQVRAMSWPDAFTIAPSQRDTPHAVLAADAALCPGCLHELFNPRDRRYRYPFITCAHCGPRFSLSRAAPFDRPHTSMHEFALCADCRREYENPEDRRFHAQTIACPACGPRLSFYDADGTPNAKNDVLAAATLLLRSGGILALKGVGGFHLLCDARNAAAVRRLRVVKGRDAKPFAVMAMNIASLTPWVHCNEEQQRLLLSPAHPIVLLEKLEACDSGLIGVAPAVPYLGVMLPYAPLHYLLFHYLAGQPAGSAWLEQSQSWVLVCTSANLSGEPLICDDSDALSRLRGMADGYICHDREIVQRCDDSVVQVIYKTPQVIRRGRGEVPRPIRLPHAGPSLLALGGDLKNTFCLTRDDQAHVSQHIGDLDSVDARRVLEKTLDQWLVNLAVKPQAVIHDGHPDFYSTRLAQRFADQYQIPCFGVQHHHAHIAAVVAERGIDRPVLGLALDGFGLGEDGGLWGGELLWVDRSRYRRLGHFQKLAMPGAERAAREPWRMAASVLFALGRENDIERRFSLPGVGMVVEMLHKKVRAPMTSSAGRWFDAAAALLGIATHNTFEGQAAMALQALALRYGPVLPSADDFYLEPDGSLNLMPLMARLAQEQDVAYGAALFHATLAEALAAWVRQAAQRESLRDVVLNGGCFMNAVLLHDLMVRLHAMNLKVHVARALPPNDGGLSLGQAWIGMAMLNGEGIG